MKKVLSTLGLTAIAELAVLPNTTLFSILCFAVIVDLMTGTLKAKLKGVARTSSGFRRTIIKFNQYGTAVLLSIIICSAAQRHSNDLLKAVIRFLNDGLIVFMIRIEAVSICENGYTCDPKSYMSKYFFKPLLHLLTFQLKNNPATKLLE